MFWILSNILQYENVSNLWSLFHFESWKQKIGIHYHFTLILCYLWCQNCLETSILALWATLVNTCWPYVCDMTKWSLGACKYLSQVSSPQISRQEIQNSSRAVEKKHFLCRTYEDGITTFIFLMWFVFKITFVWPKITFECRIW